MPERVIIVSYDPEWPGLFLQTARPMRAALGNAALRIDHIGSTSVAGLAAKPVIDIQISVASFEPSDVYRLPLEALGYVFRSNNPDFTKRYFREAPGDRRTHIHVRRAGSWSEQAALLFRDYLRAHAEDAARYAELKYRLAEQYGDDRYGYTDAKSDFIWQVMARANRWSQENGWAPGAPDV